MSREKVHPCCLTIAGSDSGGNAGVQADLRAFHAYGVHGCTVFAALTAQNPFGVNAVHDVPPDFVGAQLDAVLGVYSIAALKTGMLSSSDIISTVAERLRGHSEIAKVVDPVMVATSGARLIATDAVAAMEEKLLPLATLITPNLPEAHVLLGEDAVRPGRSDDADAAEDMARRLHSRFGCAVLVKGGHGTGASAMDVLFDGRTAERFSMDWIPSPVSTHGTGCSLAAAIVAELSLGADCVAAVRGAKRFVHDAIAGSFLVGTDCGVLGFASRSQLEPSR